MATLSEYLNDLDSDAELKAAHDAEPEGTMREYGLSEEEIQAALSGDELSVNKASGFDQTTGSSSIQVIHNSSVDNEKN